MEKACVGIDIGYGYTKIYTNRNGEPINRMFPTLVSQLSSEMTFSPVEPIQVNGNKYVVGKEVWGRAVETRTSSFVTSDPWIAVLSTALKVVGYANGYIVLGVPPGCYTRDYGDHIQDTLANSEIEIGGLHNPYKFKGNVTILPQGAGIFFHHVSTYPEHFRKNVAVVDIGHQTVDLAFFSEGKYVETGKGTYNKGISILLDDIVDSFRLLYGIEITHPEAVQILIKGKATRLGKEHEIDCTRPISVYADELIRLIESHIERKLKAVDLIILGGGGAIMLNWLSRIRYPLASVLNPQHANALGYWDWGIDKMKQESA